MSIKPDLWIRRKSTPPTHALYVRPGSSDIKELAWEGNTHTVEQLEDIERRFWAVRLKDTDPLVRDFKPMIEPFESGQVRHKTPDTFEEFVSKLRLDKASLLNRTPTLLRRNYDAYLIEFAKDSKVISYGTSSYGYDVRCADEFKIFTNINSSVIDPKNFDPQCFVDFKGDVCIIPPNSFVLARTVEHFRIPRNVLTVCLGKSTYARCFTGDTKVALVTGEPISFEDMVKRAGQGERFWGYSTDRSGRIVVAELTAPRKIGHEPVLAVTLDNGEVIRCTSDHKFLLRDGSYVEAKDLTPQTSLMPLYRTISRGYEGVWQLNGDKITSTHWLSDLWNVENGVYEHQPDTHRHHKDHARRNNDPRNLERMSASEHAALHNEERWATQEARDIHGDKISQALAQLSDDLEWCAMYSLKQRDSALAFWHDPKHAKTRERVIEDRRNPSDETRQKFRDNMAERYSTPESREEHALRMVKAWDGDVERRTNQAEIARTINIRKEITDAAVKTAFLIAGTIRGAARQLGCDRSVFRRFPHILTEFFGTPVANNHKVVSVEPVEGTHDVYCLTVPEHGNFALESGVFVKNCGIIVNVTPLEPEWEGFVTLEFSNTTTLPAKIYANEGVAQMLFFESDEACETSYKERGGKYQSQVGVVPPRI